MSTQEINIVHASLNQSVLQVIIQNNIILKVLKQVYTYIMHVNVR